MAQGFSEADRRFMERALDLARAAEAAGEVPVGAVLVRDEAVLGEGHNRAVRDHDPSAHAEVIALREAGRRVGNYRLPDSTLYVTLEPCCMCVGAIVHARVGRVVFAADDPKTGAAGGRFDLLVSPAHNHRVVVECGLAEDAAAALLVDFFRRRR